MKEPTIVYLQKARAASKEERAQETKENGFNTLN